MWRDIEAVRHPSVRLTDERLSSASMQGQTVRTVATTHLFARNSKAEAVMSKYVIEPKRLGIGPPESRGGPLAK